MSKSLNWFERPVASIRVQRYLGYERFCGVLQYLRDQGANKGVIAVLKNGAEIFLRAAGKVLRIIVRATSRKRLNEAHRAVSGRHRLMSIERINLPV